MCQIAQYSIGNYPYCRNIRNQIDGGAFAFSSSPWLITIYTSCTFNANGVKTGVLESPPPWNNTVLGVPIHRNTYPKFQNFVDLCHVQLFTLNFQDQAPLASTSLSYWFSAFGSSPSQGTFLYLNHLSKIFLGLCNCLKETSSQIQQLLVYCNDQCAQLDFTFLLWNAPLKFF